MSAQRTRKNHLTRRDLLRSSAFAGVGLWLAPSRSLQAASNSPNERLNLAIVGCGGRGRDNLKGVAGENIVALCDADQRQAADAWKAFPKAKQYVDYRKMLDDLRETIDAVVVSTPDHMHAPISLRAMRMGKHVYCEKPLTWSVEEARLMAATAKQHKVATQMGTQGMSDPGSRSGVELLRSGILGPVRELHVWTDRAKGWWPQGIDRPAGTPPVPAGLDWDLWLGVAPQRPYHPAYLPFVWRGWIDFGTGGIGDMGIHNAAAALHGLQLGAPASVEIVETSGLKPETYPEWSILRLRFPARNGQPPVTLHWYDGGKKPSPDLVGARELAANGAIVVGEKGTMYSVEWTGAEWSLLPREKFPHIKPSKAKGGEDYAAHYAQWIAACKGGAPAYCNFVDFAATVTEVMLVGALALRVGQDIQWDAQAMQAKNCPQAEPFVKRAYRKGWEL